MSVSMSLQMWFVLTHCIMAIANFGQKHASRIWIGLGSTITVCAF